MFFSNTIDMPLIEGGTDLLGFEIYIKSLENFLLNAEYPTSIALQGQRGSGKTSLMNQLNFNLCKLTQDNGIYGRSEPFYGIWLNTWQFTIKNNPNDIILSLLRNVVKQVLQIVNSNHSHEFESIASIFCSVYSAHKDRNKACFSNNPHIENLLPCEEDLDEILANPKKFRSALELAMSICIEDDRKKHYKTNGFLIFIDDLDRINPSHSVLIMQIIKNLFEVDCAAYIIAINYDIIVKGLEEKFGAFSKVNESEFKSFYNRMVQLNFNLPVKHYEIERFIENEVTRIGFYSKKECRMKIKGEDKTLLQGLVLVLELSIGFNPRLIKNLINKLSFIKILIMESEKKAKLNIGERLMIFGMLCVQTAYPTIYHLLNLEPNYKLWNEQTAKKFALAKLDEEIKEEILNIEEIDEEWKEIVYRICKENNTLTSRTFSILNLFSLITTITPKGQDPQMLFEKILNATLLVELNVLESKLNLD